MADLGEDFLQGYFGQKNLQQQKQNNQQAQQQFAQELQFRQQEFQARSQQFTQEFGLHQQEFAQRGAQYLAEQANQAAQRSHQDAIDARADSAQMWQRRIEGNQGIAKGELTQATPSEAFKGTVNAPVPGMGAVPLPQANPASNATSYAGQLLRPTTPQEQATRNLGIQAQAQQQADQQKLTSAKTLVEGFAKAYPDSTLAKNDDFKSQLFAHVATGMPIKDNESMDEFATKETNRWLTVTNNPNASPEDKAAAQKRFSTIHPILSGFYRDKSGQAAQITAAHQDRVASQEDKDTADLIAQTEKGLGTTVDKATPAARTAAARLAYTTMNAQRAAKRLPPLGVKALAAAEGAEIKGESTSGASKISIVPPSGKPIVP